MLSLDDTFRQLQERLRQPDLLNPASSDPFFYFIHDPADTLLLKQKLGAWTAALEHDGWTVEQISLSKLLWKVIDESGRFPEWQAVEADADQSDLNAAIRDVLNSDNTLVKAVAEHVTVEAPHKIAFLMDALALHPYFRCRGLESGLHDRIKVPTVLFYPGRRSGQYGLQYLGFYPIDGNYRAFLLGGLE